MMKKILLFFSILGCYNVTYNMDTPTHEENWAPTTWSVKKTASLKALRTIIESINNECGHQEILEEGVIPGEINSSTPSSEGTEESEGEDFMGEEFPLQFAFPSYDDIKNRF